MAALSYMQRRKSGTYEFRRRLPEALAGKAVPEHMRDVFLELINVRTARFKREVVRSLDTDGTRKCRDEDAIDGPPNAPSRRIRQPFAQLAQAV